MQIRQARPVDEAALRQIDAITWTADSSPAPPRSPDRPFFGPQTQPEDVLVAEADGQVIGYVHLEQASPSPHTSMSWTCPGWPSTRPGKATGRAGGCWRPRWSRPGSPGARKLALMARDL